MRGAGFKKLLSDHLAPVLAKHGFEPTSATSVAGDGDQIAGFSMEAARFTEGFPAVAQFFDLEIDDVDLAVVWTESDLTLSVEIEGVSIEDLAARMGIPVLGVPEGGSLRATFFRAGDLTDRVLAPRTRRP